MQSVAFPTIHGKHELLSNLFLERLGWQFVVPQLDTDAFGTFAGEVPRAASPRETVLAKAKAGAMAAGLPAAVASEGTIGLNPALPLMTTDTELLAYVDLERGVEFVQSHLSANIVAVRETWHPESNFESLIRRAALPDHGVIVRAERPEGIETAKGIHSAEELRALIDLFVREPGVTEVVIESDFRANHSPSRQANIIACAEKLVTRLAAKCPNCHLLGWGVVEVQKGLPCEVCGTEVARAVRSEVFGCIGCEYIVEAPLATQSADASSCDYCNP